MNPRNHLLAGQAIPAQPLALDSRGRFSERHQRAITRYYLDSGVGGLAVGVHSTQFEIREPKHALFRPVLELASETVDAALARSPRPFIKIAGICGSTRDALAEAALARSFGYDAGLLSLTAVRDRTDAAILGHCRRVANDFPVIGFYLQPAVGGRFFSYEFWRSFAEIPNVLAIKIAPFNRYQTIDVVRAVADSGRDDIALYTGNDDSIVVDLLARYAFRRNGRNVVRKIAGGLLGHWGVWTRSAVRLFEELKKARLADRTDARWLETANAVTDMNAALFDPRHGFKGCIPGIMEVLRRQGLVPSARCLDPRMRLSHGQAAEITRVVRAYPSLVDDAFVAANLDRWLK